MATPCDNKSGAKQRSDRDWHTRVHHYVHVLPSSVWVSHWHVASTATPPANSARVGWRGASAGAHFIVIPTGRRHGSPSTSAGGHSVKPAVSAAGPAPTHGEPSHEPAAATPLLKHHRESTIFICFVVEVRVIGLCAALYGSLEKEDRERFAYLKHRCEKNKLHLLANVLFLT